MSWKAITPSAAASATTSAITSGDGRPRGALGGAPPPPPPESPGGPGGGSWATGCGDPDDVARRLAVAGRLSRRDRRLGGHARRPLARVAVGAGELRQVAGEVARAGVAVLGALRHRPGADLVDRRRQVGPQVGDTGNGVLDVREEHRDVALAWIRDGACEALVEHASERVDVGAMVGLAPLHLLGRHVVDRAEELARVGQARPRHLVLHETEVGEVGVVDGLAVATRPLGKDVRGLDVAVDEPALVRDAQAARDLRDQLG